MTKLRTLNCNKVYLTTSELILEKKTHLRTQMSQNIDQEINFTTKEHNSSGQKGSTMFHINTTWIIRSQQQRKMKLKQISKTKKLNKQADKFSM